MGEYMVLIVIQLGALAIAVTAIWLLLSKFNKALDDKISVVVDRELDKSEERMGKMMDEKDKSSNKDVISEIKALEKTFVIHANKQEAYNKNDVRNINLLREGLIESYKRNIRDLYYKLRDDGTVSDADMAYIQKIFPKYIALGGNSDIEAKVKEMQEVYSTVTQEKFKEARKKVAAKEK